MSLKWTSQNIKLESSDNIRLCYAKLNLTRNTEKWSAKFNAFWLVPQNAEVWIIGNGAKLLFKLDSASGNQSKRVELNPIEWDTFLYKAGCCVIYSAGKLIMKGNLAGHEQMSNMTIQTLLISERSKEKLPIPKTLKKDIEKQEVIKINEPVKVKKSETENIIIDNKFDIQTEIQESESTDKIISSENDEKEISDKVKKLTDTLNEPLAENQKVNETLENNVTDESKTEDIIQQNIETKKKILPNMDDLKKILARKPIERTIPSIRDVKINPLENKMPVKCDFMLWNVERIEEEVESNPAESPFVGTFKGSKFARIDISTRDSFDHLLVGRVPLDNIPVYMLCIPGPASQPPIGVKGFGRWIPTKDGKGYWVKYITK